MESSSGNKCVAKGQAEGLDDQTIRGTRTRGPKASADVCQCCLCRWFESHAVSCVLRSPFHVQVNCQCILGVTAQKVYQNLIMKGCNKEVEQFQERIKMEAEDLVLKKFPTKMLDLNNLLHVSQLLVYILSQTTFCPHFVCTRKICHLICQYSGSHLEY